VFDDRVLLETGLTRGVLSRELRLNELLNDFSNACLDEGVNCALFGGTAINKIYLKGAARFSEDLDMHAFSCSKKKVSSLLEDLSFDVKGPARIFKEFYRWVLGFEEDGVPLAINLDCGLAYKAPLSKVVFGRTQSFLNSYGFRLPALRIPSYGPETLAAMKCLALMSRAEGKDYYDLHGLLKTQDLDVPKALGEAYKYKGALFDFVTVNDSFFEDVGRRIEETDAKDLRQCDVFIPIARRPDWESLKNELAFLVKKKLCKKTTRRQAA